MALRQLAFDLLERSAQTCKRVLRNTDTSIRDRERDEMISRPATDRDPAPGRCELYGIGKQVERHLLERTAVGSYSKLWRNSRGDLQCLVLGACGNDPHCIIEQGVERDIGKIE